VPEILFIIYGGMQLIFMPVPAAAAQRDPQIDTIDLVLPFIATAVLCVGVRLVEDTASIMILTFWLFCAHVRVWGITIAQTPQTIIVVSVLGWLYFADICGVI